MFALYIIIIFIIFYLAGKKPGPISNVVFNNFTITWDAAPLASSYKVKYYAVNDLSITPDHFNVNTKELTASFTFQINSGDGNKHIIYEIIPVNFFGNGPSYIGSSSACFPAGTKVSTKEGIKNIEDVLIGDIVIGPFYERNVVLALQHVAVGQNVMIKINDRHITTDHHPHLSENTDFLVFDKSLISNVYGSEHLVYDGSSYVLRHLDGLSKHRLKNMLVGSKLKTLEPDLSKSNGSETIEKIEIIKMDPHTPLYNLVVSGSHIYNANGFFVTGWPSEKDFNYDDWVPVL